MRFLQLTFLFSMLVSTMSFADSVDFFCIEDKKVTYEFHLNFGEVYAFDNEGLELNSYDGLSTEIQFLETKPGQTSYILTDDEGYSFATVNFIDGNIVGKGYLGNESKPMVCVRPTL